MAQHLLVVERTRPDVYELLKRNFAGAEDVAVILDRRQRERRQGVEVSGVEQRLADRRSYSTDAELRSLSFALVRTTPAARKEGDGGATPESTLDRGRLPEEMIQVGITLTSERDLDVLLERILDAARRLTRADAGTLFLREGDQLRFAIVQNDSLAARVGKEEMRRRLQAEPLPLSQPSLASYVALSGVLINIPDAYAIGLDRPVFSRQVDARTDYVTRSVLAVPLKDGTGNVLGVLELINAQREENVIVPFRREHEDLARLLACQAALAILWTPDRGNSGSPTWPGPRPSRSLR